MDWKYLLEHRHLEKILFMEILKLSNDNIVYDFLN